MINEFLGNKDIDMTQIDPGALLPVLKCIQGDYTGRFCYLRNCNPDEEETTGEIIGGKPDYDINQNPKNLTLYISDPKIDEVHCRVFCRKYPDINRYIIQDLSNHENKEASGVWI